MTWLAAVHRSPEIVLNLYPSQETEQAQCVWLEVMFSEVFDFTSKSCLWFTFPQLEYVNVSDYLGKSLVTLVSLIISLY